MLLPTGGPCEGALVTVVDAQLLQVGEPVQTCSACSTIQFAVEWGDVCVKAGEVGNSRP
jgi:hypothetical protein